MLAPPEYKALHPLGSAPVITDGGLVLAESGAIMEYITAKHGGGRLTLKADHPDFAPYLYWFHFANGTLQAAMGRQHDAGPAEARRGRPGAGRRARRGSTTRSTSSRRG